MHNITLIGTVHSENGKCNSDELYKIIDTIGPEIIFEEISPNGFSAIYQRSRYDTLESKTIKKYLQKHPIDHVPVDLDGNEFIDISLKKNIEEMFDIFFLSSEYQDISTQLRNLSEQHGFPYLNSDHCREIMESTRILEEDIFKMIDNDRLFQTYKVWLDIIDKRENEMIKNIYTYSALNKYSSALFLIGSEHRKPIMDKMPNFEKNNKLELKWLFNYFK